MSLSACLPGSPEAHGPLIRSLGTSRSWIIRLDIGEVEIAAVLGLVLVMGLTAGCPGDSEPRSGRRCDTAARRPRVADARARPGPDASTSRRADPGAPSDIGDLERPLVTWIMQHPEVTWISGSVKDDKTGLFLARIRDGASSLICAGTKKKHACFVERDTPHMWSSVLELEKDQKVISITLGTLPDHLTKVAVYNFRFPQLTVHRAPSLHMHWRWRDDTGKPSWMWPYRPWWFIGKERPAPPDAPRIPTESGPAWLDDLGALSIYPTCSTPGFTITSPGRARVCLRVAGRWTCFPAQSAESFAGGGYIHDKWQPEKVPQGNVAQVVKSPGGATALIEWDWVSEVTRKTDAMGGTFVQVYRLKEKQPPVLMGIIRNGIATFGYSIFGWRPRRRVYAPPSLLAADCLQLLTPRKTRIRKSKTEPPDPLPGHYRVTETGLQAGPCDLSATEGR